jgi:phosphatidate cytidylyltransferase
MKTRVISAAFAIALLAVIVYLGGIAIGIAVSVLAFIGIIEFYKALSKGGFKPSYVLGGISCLPLVYAAFSGILPKGLLLEQAHVALAAAIFVFVLIVVLFCLIMFTDGSYRIKDAAATLFGIAYVVFPLSFVTLTRNMDQGWLYMWMIFIGAWATDTFAYFFGVTLGRTKIVPKISPKKSLEGCVGGVVGCAAAMTAFGAYFNSTLGVPLVHFVVIGLICGVISQLGDWSASVIKRAVGIKDYGNIMPGHGGVMDRVDSILFTAPVVYFYISLFF